MKKMFFVASVCTALILAGCASSPKAAAPVSKHVEREIIDWKGAAIGSPVPAWVESAINGDKAAFMKMEQFEGKMVLIADQRGKNENALKSWVNNVDVKGGMAKSLSDFVIAKFGSEGQGSPDEAEEWDSFMSEMTSTFSKMEVNGMLREMDYWVKTRTFDKDSKTSEDLYQYIVVYSIDKSIFNEQLEKALGHIEVKNEKQKKMKDDVKAGILEAQVFGESNE